MLPFVEENSRGKKSILCTLAIIILTAFCFLTNITAMYTCLYYIYDVGVGEQAYYATHSSKKGCVYSRLFTTILVVCNMRYEGSLIADL